MNNLWRCLWLGSFLWPGHHFCDQAGFVCRRFLRPFSLLFGSVLNLHLNLYPWSPGLSDFRYPGVYVSWLLTSKAYMVDPMPMVEPRPWWSSYPLLTHAQWWTPCLRQCRRSEDAIYTSQCVLFCWFFTKVEWWITPGPRDTARYNSTIYPIPIVNRMPMVDSIPMVDPIPMVDSVSMVDPIPMDN